MPRPKSKPDPEKKTVTENVSLSSYDLLHQKIRMKYDDLPKRLKQIADFILNNPEDIALGTVSSIASSAGVQPSSIIRFSRLFEFSGFSELQKVFREDLLTKKMTYKDRVKLLHKKHDDNLKSVAILDGFYNASLESIHELHRNLNPKSLEAAISSLSIARCIYILGLRRSMPVARYFSYLLTRLEIRHQVLGLESGMEEEAILTASPRDAALVISFTNYAERTIQLFNSLSGRKVPIVSLTDSPASPVISPTGVWLEVMEADYQGFRSNAATMLLIMTLAAGIAERRK